MGVLLHPIRPSVAPMVAEAEVKDSPVGWVADHIQKYVETDGAVGHEWNGTKTLLLTVTGRTSGEPRRTALIYATDGEDFLIVASNGGGTEPQWYTNLVVTPKVEVQVGARKFTAEASTASPEEKIRMWPKVVAAWAPYDEYQQKADREIPVVVLHPTQG